MNYQVDYKLIRAKSCQNRTAFSFTLAVGFKDAAEHVTRYQNHQGETIEILGVWKCPDYKHRRVSYS